MPAVLRRDEATGQNYVHRIGITQSVTGGLIVKVIDEEVNSEELVLYFVVSLEPPSDLEVY